MTTKIGTLRHRVVFQKPVDISDGQGGFTRSWQDVIEMWAEIRPTSARERWFSQQVQMTVTHKVTIRYNSVLKPDLVSSLRISYKGRIFQIHGIRLLDERRFWQELDCEENVGT